MSVAQKSLFAEWDKENNMEFPDAVLYVAMFSLMWLFTLFLAAGLDVALRRVFGIKLFPDNYWRSNDDCR